MATQLIIPRQLDANGDAASGAKALVYETGTTTPVTVYTDTGLSVAHASPIVADSAGYFAQAFYGGSTALKVVVTDSADATLVTYDPVPLVSLSSSAASDVTFAPTTEITQTNVQAAIVAVEATIGTTAGTEDGAITTAKIADGAVTRVKLATPPALEWIASQDAASDATLDFTGFDATKYDAYKFVISNLTPSADNLLFMRTSTDGGSTYDSGASDYGYGNTITLFSTAASANSGSTGTTAMVIGGFQVESTADGLSCTIDVMGPHLAKETRIKWDGLAEGTTAADTIFRGAGTRLSSADVDAVRFLFAAGNINSGTVTMYGLRNS